MEWTTGFNKDNQARPLSDSAEIIANCWYVVDALGFIYSLRIQIYVCEGSEAQKGEFLKSRAYLDYLVARPFPVPKRFRTRFPDDGRKAGHLIVHHDAAVALGGLDQLFFERLDQMQQDLPSQSKIAIPQSPLMKITALLRDKDGSIVPLDVIGDSNP